MLEAGKGRAGRNRLENGKQTPCTFGGSSASMPRALLEPVKLNDIGDNSLIPIKGSRLEQREGESGAV